MFKVLEYMVIHKTCIPFPSNFPKLEMLYPKGRFLALFKSVTIILLRWPSRMPVVCLQRTDVRRKLITTLVQQFCQNFTHFVPRIVNMKFELSRLAVSED